MLSPQGFWLSEGGFKNEVPWSAVSSMREDAMAECMHIELKDKTMHGESVGYFTNSSLDISYIELKAINRYKLFVAEGKGQPSPWLELRSQVFLGDEEFVTRLQGLIDGDKELSEIPSSQRRALPMSLEQYELDQGTRDQAITQAYSSGGYTQKEIGDHFGLHYSRVSRILAKTKGKT